MHAVLADLLDFTAAPAWGDPQSTAVRWRPAHWLLIGADGRIAGVQPQEPGPGWIRHDHRGCLLMPGFIDTHVHSPQLAVLASWGTQLLDWLETYTFPAETAWADPGQAQAGSQRFVQALLAHGTTTAVVFPTVHAHSVDALFEAAEAQGMGLITGKVLMDRHAPAALCDPPDIAAVERTCVDQIQRWHGRGRQRVAVTVRFAPTSTEAQLAMAGALCRADPTLYLQTHVAENRDEVRWVAELFPQARSYLDVYARHGLLHRRSVLAHGIWLDDADRAALRDAGAQVAHSPSSNLFLGSGLIDWAALRAAGAAVTLASDVGGGTSLSMQRTAAAACQVQALQGQRLTAWVALHAATRGAAQALQLDHQIGTLDTGRLADFCLWRWATDEVQALRQARARDLHEKCYAWLWMSDERHLVQTWIAGRPRWSAPATGAVQAPDPSPP